MKLPLQVYTEQTEEWIKFQEHFKLQIILNYLLVFNEWVIPTVTLFSSRVLFWRALDDSVDIFTQYLYFFFFLKGLNT